MRIVSAIIEMASDGNYSVYMDADDMDYLVTATGATSKEAIEDFKKGYEDIKSSYARDGKHFEEVEFEFKYDMASFLSFYTQAFSLAGLSRITGINKSQLSHYATGHRKPSRTTIDKIQKSVHEFANELSQVHFAWLTHIEGVWLMGGASEEVPLFICDIEHLLINNFYMEEKPKEPPLPPPIVVENPLSTNDGTNGFRQ